MKKIDKEIILKIQSLYSEGETQNNIATILGISRSSVVQYVKNIKNRKTKRTEEEKKAYSVKAVQKRRLKIKELSLEYKGGKCERCGYNKCKNALEFHHIDPKEKDFGIGDKGYTRSWEKIKIELDKCILVCANCHREIHSEINKSK